MKDLVMQRNFLENFRHLIRNMSNLLYFQFYPFYNFSAFNQCINEINYRYSDSKTKSSIVQENITEQLGDVKQCVSKLYYITLLFYVLLSGSSQNFTEHSKGFIINQCVLCPKYNILKGCYKLQAIFFQPVIVSIYKSDKQMYGIKIGTVTEADKQRKRQIDICTRCQSGTRRRKKEGNGEWKKEVHDGRWYKTKKAAVVRELWHTLRMRIAHYESCMSLFSSFLEPYTSIVFYYSDTFAEFLKWLLLLHE